MRPCIVITGASSGIGAACVQRFLAEGWDIGAVGRRCDRLEALAKAGGERVRPIVADLSQEAGIAAIARGVEAWRKDLAAIAHCAGDFLVAPIEATTPAEFERIWRITVWAKHMLTRALLARLEGRGAPKAIVHVASLAAHEDFAGETAYMSAMHGLIGLARAQDIELRDRGIRAAVVSPGLVRTELTERSGFGAAALEQALTPGAIADSVFQLVKTIREGGYIGEIFHRPGVGPSRSTLSGPQN